VEIIKKKNIKRCIIQLYNFMRDSLVKNLFHLFGKRQNKDSVIQHLHIIVLICKELQIICSKLEALMDLNKLKKILINLFQSKKKKLQKKKWHV